MSYEWIFRIYSEFEKQTNFQKVLTPSRALLEEMTAGIRKLLVKLVILKVL